jgi:hypothetical protein
MDLTTSTNEINGWMSMDPVPMASCAATAMRLIRWGDATADTITEAISSCQQRPLEDFQITRLSAFSF